MATIYLSSTDEDLKDHREAVYDALRRLRHDVRAMEHYVATDQRPVDKCLADVAACDIYVGILAWRYENDGLQGVRGGGPRRWTASPCMSTRRTPSNTPAEPMNAPSGRAKEAN